MSTYLCLRVDTLSRRRVQYLRKTGATAERQVVWLRFAAQGGKRGAYRVKLLF